MIAYNDGLSVDTLSVPGPKRDAARTGGESPRRQGKSGEPRKMKNSGNEAKEYLKTKDITFLNDANYACLARKSAQIGR